MVKKSALHFLLMVSLFPFVPKAQSSKVYLFATTQVAGEPQSGFRGSVGSHERFWVESHCVSNVGHNVQDSPTSSLQ